MASQYVTDVFELHPTRAKGRSRTTALGQHMGRPPKLTPHQQKEARGRRAEGSVSDRAIEVDRVKRH